MHVAKLHHFLAQVTRLILFYSCEVRFLSFVNDRRFPVQ